MDKEFKSQKTTSLENTLFEVCDQICGVLLNYGMNYKDAIDMTADIAKEIVDILIIKRKKYDELTYIESWTDMQRSQDLKALAF